MLGGLIVGLPGRAASASVPSNGSSPYGNLFSITRGPHGSLWFTEGAAGKIGTLHFSLPASGLTDEHGKHGL
jgi:hypothetical protein